MFYSKQTGGFYSREIHGDNIPSDAVEISAEQHRELIAGQSSGKRIVADESGCPVLIDPPAPDPQIAMRAEAISYLNSTDWYFARLAETGQAVPDEVLQKRADARAVLNEVTN